MLIFDLKVFRKMQGKKGRQVWETICINIYIYIYVCVCKYITNNIGV